MPVLTAEEAEVERLLREAMKDYGNDRAACVEAVADEIAWVRHGLGADTYGEEAIKVASAMVGAVWDRRIEAAS